jgi:hypothetical protein
VSRKREVQQTRQPLNAGDRQFFTDIVHSDTHAAALARVIFVATLPFLFAVDAEFSEVELLPLLDWERDEARALQCWQGLISGARWSPLADKLRPLLSATFAHLDQFRQDYREALAGRVAHLSIFGSDDPLSEGWLADYIKRAGETDRCEFARTLEQYLEICSPEQLQSLWKRWLNQYVDFRTRGLPVPISRREVQTMLTWGPHLRPVFVEFARLIAATRIEIDYSGPFIRGLARTDLPQEFPESVCDLLGAVLQNDVVYDWNEVGKIVRMLIEGQAPREKLLAICEQLARLGCPDARQLRSLIA